MIRYLKGFVTRSRNDIKAAGFDSSLTFLVMMTCIDVVMLLALFPFAFGQNSPFFVIGVNFLLGLLLFRCWVGSLGQDVRVTDLGARPKGQ